MKIAICAIAKRENDYVNEWANYHLNLGVDHIFLWDNNDSSYEDVATRFDERIKDKITIFPIHDQWGNQIERYKETYKNYSKDFDWMAFIDLDEFITFKEDTSLKVFLAKDLYRDVDAIQLTWKNYGDGGIIERNPKEPVLSAGFTPSKDTQSQAKSIARCNRPIEPACEHFFQGLGDYQIYQVYADGERINDRRIVKPRFCDICWVKHFRTRSLSEFINNKFNRTDASHKESGTHMGYYFRVNEKTPEKMKYIKERGIY